MERLFDFCIIGATKSATSWLQVAAMKHPELAIVPHETYFFTKYHERGLDYLKPFLVSRRAGLLFGDYSNDYLTESRLAAARLHAHNPDMRLVVSLRNPVSRAESFYRMLYRGHRISGTPGQEIVPGTRMYDEGFYFERLRDFAEVFGRERLHVIVQEDIRRDPEAVLANYYRFLGVDNAFLPDGYGEAYNVSRKHRPKHSALHQRLVQVVNSLAFLGERGTRIKQALRSSRIVGLYHRINRGEQVAPLSAAEKARLARAYAPDAARLSDWLGRDLVREWNLETLASA